MINFHNTYKNLPDSFYKEILPSGFAGASLLKFNEELSKDLGLNLESLSSAELADLFSGNKIPEGSDPIALAYAGHQFGHFSPQLGDGRAVLLGEIQDPDGKRFDIQLKGSGVTPFSRRGDGLSPLGPALREYLVSEAMYHLGIPTTRSLAVVSTGEKVYREEILAGAVLTRVAASHIRVGTFEYFFYQKDFKSLKILADYTLERHYPHLLEKENSYLELLRIVAHKKLDLVTDWLAVGFIHGVMNTDNTSISGETIDYGPCAFMDHFQFDKTFSFIDRNKRYAYGNQGNIALWNISALAQCFSPLIDQDSSEGKDSIKKLLDKLPDYFNLQWQKKIKMKLGVFNQTPDDSLLIKKWFDYLEEESLDFTNSFRNLSKILAEDSISKYFNETKSFKDFYKDWKKMIEQENQDLSKLIISMNQINPAIIPRNHLIEKAIEDAYNGDFTLFNSLNSSLSDPFNDKQTLGKTPPEKKEIVHQTFCGT